VLDAVAAQRGPATVVQERLAVVAAQLEEIEEHVLMVALEKDTRRAVAPQAEEAIDDALRRRSAVDVVAEKDELIVGSRREMVEKDVEFVDAAVEVPDGEEPGHTSPRCRSPQRLAGFVALHRAQGGLVGVELAPLEITQDAGEGAVVHCLLESAADL